MEARTFKHEQHSPWFKYVKTIELFHCQDREHMLEQERYFIKELHPLYNTLHNHNFRSFVYTHSVDDTPVGDFILDAREDVRFPLYSSWEQYEGYITLRTQNIEAHTIAKQLWEEFAGVGN